MRRPEQSAGGGSLGGGRYRPGVALAVIDTLLAIVVLQLPTAPFQVLHGDAYARHLGCVSAPTAAESAGNLPAETPGPQPTANATDTTRIDGQTEIIGSEYLPDEGIARITLRSSAVQTVTISDAGRFQEGGKIPVRTVASARTTRLARSRHRKRRLEVSRYLRCTPQRVWNRQPSGGDSTCSERLALQAWLAGATVAFVWMIVAGYNVIAARRRPEEHEAHHRQNNRTGLLHAGRYKLLIGGMLAGASRAVR